VRILQVAPLVAPIDERREPIGGAQVAVADLARALARRGHAVSLAAADGSFVSGVSSLDLRIDHRTLRTADLGERSGPRPDDAAQRAAFARVRQWLDAHAAAVDVVHAHAYDAPAFDLLRGAPRPVVHTLHLGPRDAEVARAAREARDATCVTVSESNARAWREAGVAVRTIYNGVDVAAIPLGTRRGDHLLYAGRLSPEKGVEVALDVADALHRGIVLVGGIYDAAYHARVIAPRVSTRPIRHGEEIRGALYVGHARRDAVWSLMSEAAATLLPVRADEPFGLVAVESLAAGTPVVAFRRGGLAEILDGPALVPSDDTRAFIRAVDAIIGTDPATLRERARRFDLGITVSAYEDLYRHIA
jgi:glycosyltransferase involved in cell wall biosynthesis